MGTKELFIQPYSLSGIEAKKNAQSFSDIFTDNSYIYEISPASNSKKNIEISLIPSIYTEWIIGYNDSNDSSIFYCIGSVTQKTTVSLQHFDHFFGVRFNHTGCYFNKGLLSSPTPADLLADQFSYKPEKDSAEASFVSCLKATDNFKEHVKAFNSLLKNSKEFYSISEGALNMTEIILSSKGNATISSLAENSGYSERHITRIFKTAFGYCPKDFCKYVRFQNVLAEIISDPNRENSEFILGTGYSDQAHFQREFKIFMEETPKAFISTLMK